MTVSERLDLHERPTNVCDGRCFFDREPAYGGVSDKDVYSIWTEAETQ
jgi:hypothetical protein